MTVDRLDEGSPRELPEGWDEIVDGLQAEGDVVVTKRQCGAFHGTDLDLQLRRRGIATNMGVILEALGA